MGPGLKLWALAYSLERSEEPPQAATTLEEPSEAPLEPQLLSAAASRGVQLQLQEGKTGVQPPQRRRHLARDGPIGHEKQSNWARRLETLDPKWPYVFALSSRLPAKKTHVCYSI